MLILSDTSINRHYTHKHTRIRSQPQSRACEAGKVALASSARSFLTGQEFIVQLRYCSGSVPDQWIITNW